MLSRVIAFGFNFVKVEQMFRSNSTRTSVPEQDEGQSDATPKWPPRQSLRPRPRRLPWRLESIQVARWMVIGVCVALIFTNAWLVMESRSQTLDQSRKANTNLARAVAERVGSSIADVEHVLHAIAFELERSGPTQGVVARLPPLLNSQVTVTEQLAELYVYARDGLLLASTSNADAMPLEAAKTILDQHATTTDRFVLGGPRRRASGEWVFPLSRRLEDAQGGMAGVIVATLSIRHLSEVLNRFELGHSGAITLTLEHVVLVRRPKIESYVGVRASPKIMQKVFGSRRAGDHEDVSPVDGVFRLYSFDSVAKYPIRVTVADGKDEALRSWRLAAILQMVWVFFLCGVLWFAATWVRVLMRRQQEDKASLHKARDELTRANVELSRLAQFDALTGMPNRRSFNAKLEQVFRHAQRHHRPMSVVMLDIDVFKKFNDVYGHVAGDRCLQQVAMAIRPMASRAQDFIARYGGEEFALLLPETEMAGAIQVAETACQAVAALQIAHAASPLGKVTISVGVASGVPSSEDGPYTLVEAADAALYDAKRAGKNRVSSEPSVFGALT